MGNYLDDIGRMFPSLIRGGKRTATQGIPRGVLPDNTAIDVAAVEVFDNLSPYGGLMRSLNNGQTPPPGKGGGYGDYTQSPPRGGALTEPILNTIYEDYRGLPGWALPAAVGGSIALGYGYSQLPLGNDQEQSDKPPSSPTPKATSNSLPPSSNPSPSPSSTSNAIPSPDKEGTVRYKIKKGDTLWGMTQDWDEINAIAKANNISDPNKIYADAYINLTPEQDLLRRTLASKR